MTDTLLRLNEIAGEVVRRVPEQYRDDYRQEIVLNLYTRPFDPEKGPFDNYFRRAACRHLNRLRYMEARVPMTLPEGYISRLVDSTWEDRFLDELHRREYVERFRPDDREIYAYLEAGYPVSEIAETVQLTKARIYQKINRMRRSVKATKYKLKVDK
jgi:DNA-directed RNA polymerase specialized sigma24 family protein